MSSGNPIDVHLEHLRSDRKRFLEATDWIEIVDTSVISDENRTIMRNYRQSLRDITTNATLETEVPPPPNIQ